MSYKLIQSLFQNNLKSILPTIFFVVITSILSIQAKDNPFKKWDLYDFTKEAGLQTTNIFQIDFYKDNTAWLATSNGLLKYDGYNWKTYTTKQGLPSNFVRTVKIIGKDSLWIGTDNGAVFFDGEKFRSQGSEEGLIKKNVRLINSDNKGTIWFCSDSWPMKTETGGLSYFKQGKWYSEKAFKNKYVVNIFQDKDGKYFVITDQGIYIKNGNKWEKQILGNKTEKINWTSSSIIQLKNLSVVVSTGNKIFILKDSKWETLKNVPDHSYGIANFGSNTFAIYNQVNPHYKVFSIYKDGKFETATGEHKTIRGYIENITTDPSGNIWAVGYGLILKWSFKNYEWNKYDDNASEILFPYKNNIILLEKNKIISREKNGKVQEIIKLSTKINYSKLNKTFWDSNEIFFIEETGFRKIAIPSNLKNSSIKNVLMAANSEWILINNGNISELYNIVENKWLKVNLPKNIIIDNINTNKIKSKLWLEFRNKNNDEQYVGRYQDKRISIITAVPKIAGGSLMSVLFIDSNDGLWIYSESGAHYYNTESKKWDKINGLLGREISSITEFNNAIWLVNTSIVGGKDGISKINLIDKNITNYQTDLIICSYSDNENYLLLGSINKFYIIEERTFFRPYLINTPAEAKIQTISRYLDGSYLMKSENGIYELQPSVEQSIVDFSESQKRANVESKYVLKLNGKRKFISEDLKNNFMYSIKVNDGNWTEFKEESEIILDTDSLNIGSNMISAKCLDIGLGNNFVISDFEIIVQDIPIQKKPYFIIVILIGLGLMTALAFYAFRSEGKLKKLVDKKTDELLKTTTEYQNLFESANDAIIIFEPETEKILKVNDKTARLYGFTKDELIGMSLKKITVNVEAGEKQIQKTLELKSFNNFETKHTTKDGRVIDLLVNATLIEYENQVAILSINHEITELKRIEEERKKLTSIIEMAEDFIATADTNGNALYINKAGRKMLGIGENEDISKVTIAESHPEWARKIVINEAIPTAIKKGTWYGENAFLSREGRVIPISQLILAHKSEKGDVTYFSTIARDITESKRSELLIKESETKYKNLFENNPLPMWIYDLETLKFIDVNDTACFKYGYTRDEFLNMTLIDIRPEDEIAKLRENLKNAELNIENSGVWKHRKKDGGIILVEIISHKLPTNDNRRLRLVIANDVTEKVKAENALNESEKKFRNIFETANEGICVTNKDDQIISVNLKFSEMVGFGIDELLGRDFRSLMMDQDLNEYKERMKERNVGENDRYEARLIRNGGSKIWISVAATPIIDENGMYDGSFGMFTDITEQKFADLEIRKLSRGVEQSPATIIITDKQGNIEYVNEKFCETTGYTFPEVIGENPRILKSGDKTKEEYKEIWDTILNGNEWSGEFRNKKKNGELYWEFTSISAIKDDRGEITHFIAIKEDITERKKMVGELIEAKEKAEQSNKLKSEFLAQMSHEIRTPIHVVASSVSLFQEELEEGIRKEYDDLFISIELASKRIIRTIDLILNASEMQTSGYKPKFVKINVDHDILSKLYNEHKQIAEVKNLEFVYNYRAKDNTITADEYSVTQIFANLIDNALKYTKVGKVEIIVLSNNNKDLLVEVKDTGIGMSKEFMKRMYEPFVQEDQGYSRAYEGNGLGLSLVKKYCELNNAIIEVESKKNIGSTFRVIFRQKG